MNSKVYSRLYPYILMLPVLVIIGGGLIYPLIRTLIISSQYHVIFKPNDIHFNGFQNYVELIQDKYFWRALKASAIWVTGSVIPQLLLGLGMALVLNQNFRGRGLVRTIILSPWVLSGVVTGIIWKWIFDGTIGVVNDLMMKLNLITLPIPFGIRPASAFLTLFFANAWRGAPFFAITILAALQSINPEMYEAAEVDGAGMFQKFRFITLPLIFNTIIVSTLLRTIWTFNWIDLIITMTEGGPISSTRTLAMYIYDTAYKDGNFGYAATLSVALCVILTIFSFSYLNLSRESDVE